MRPFIVAWALFLSACASPSQRPPSATPPAGVAPPRKHAWVSPLDRDHVLVGRIWDVAARRFVDENALLEEVVRAPLVVVGEQHDNADAHALQATLLAAIVHGGRGPALVAEMLDETVQPKIQTSLAERPGDVDGFALAVDWANSGWPDWSLYRPVFATAVDARLPIVAAGVDRNRTMEIAEQGILAAAPEVVRKFGLEKPLAPPVQAAFRDEMRDMHCGMLPDEMLDSMVLIQRFRDAVMASHLVDAAGAGGAVLIAGNGHARSDRGVPALVRAYLGRAVLSVGLLEVSHDRTEPPAYAASFSAPALPFDYVWFTPRVSDADHCAEIHSPQKT